jgi:hypothetical protein
MAYSRHLRTTEHKNKLSGEPLFWSISNTIDKCQHSAVASVPGKREQRMYEMFQVCMGPFEGLDSVSCWQDSACSNCSENKKEMGNLYRLLTPAKKARDYGSLKKKLANLFLTNSMEKIHPQEHCRINSCANWWRRFPSWSQSVKTERGSYLFIYLEPRTE